jgi:phytoene dehydrogenase-like protein
MGTRKYDSVIIGAGLSGLASGIRLAQFGKNVLVVEKHSIIGGLNSFYSRFGRKIDVGLHAITNFVKKGISKSPLSKLLRQLRIPDRKSVV